MAWENRVRDAKNVEIGEERFERAIAEAKKEWDEEERAKRAAAEEEEEARYSLDIEQNINAATIEGHHVLVPDLKQGKTALEGAAEQMKSTRISSKVEKSTIKGASVVAGRVLVEDPVALGYIFGTVRK